MYYHLQAEVAMIIQRLFEKSNLI